MIGWAWVLSTHYHHSSGTKLAKFLDDIFSCLLFIAGDVERQQGGVQKESKSLCEEVSRIIVNSYILLFLTCHYSLELLVLLLKDCCHVCYSDKNTCYSQVKPWTQGNMILKLCKFVAFYNFFSYFDNRAFYGCLPLWLPWFFLFSFVLDTIKFWRTGLCGPSQPANWDYIHWYVLIMFFKICHWSIIWSTKTPCHNHNHFKYF